MNENEKRKRRLITWKDADQNLCTLAASILDDASAELRATEELTGRIQIFPPTLGPPAPTAWPVDGGEPVKAGMAEDGGHRSFWSAPWEQMNTNDDLLETQYLPQLTPQCWFSFQNLVMMRLKEAREDLRKNRYLKNNKFKSSEQISRNPLKRPEGSKFGRTPER